MTGKMAAGIVMAAVPLPHGRKGRQAAAMFTSPIVPPREPRVRPLFAQGSLAMPAIWIATATESGARIEEDFFGSRRG